MLQHTAVSVAALCVVAGTGGFLTVLGVMALLRPRSVQAFLLGFAATHPRHVLELAVRILVGVACLLAAPRLEASGAFQVAGAVLLVTSVLMALLPYRWHKAFASRAVPRALPFLPFVGLASLAAGLVVTWLAWLAIWP